MAASAVGAAACGSGAERFQQTAQSWVGATEQQLTDAFGTPDGFYPAPNGDRVLRYEYQRTVSGISPDFYAPRFGYGWYGSGYGGWYGVQRTELRECDLTFRIRESRIIGYATRGGDCYAYDLPAPPPAIDWNAPRPSAPAMQ